MKIPAIIPARGGSKGVPDKNIKTINGIPLVAYPIIEAKKSEYIDRVYVSTDDKKIAGIAEQFGAEIIDRPSIYAQDHSPDIDVMKHAVHVLKWYDDIIHLRATTPMIDHKILDLGVRHYLSNEKATSMRSAHESPETAYKQLKINDQYWSGLFDNELKGDYWNSPRQSLPKTYQPNGYIDIINGHHFMNKNSLYGDKCLAYITPYAHEVDTIEDFEILGALYDTNKK